MTGTQGATTQSVVQAVVLRRVDEAAVSTSGVAQRRVINRMLGPQMTASSGTLRLVGTELAAYHAGLLSMAVFGNAGADPVAEVSIRAPK